jgi:hypothetical protein
MITSTIEEAFRGMSTPAQRLERSSEEYENARARGSDQRLVRNESATQRDLRPLL